MASIARFLQFRPAFSGAVYVVQPFVSSFHHPTPVAPLLLPMYLRYLRAYMLSGHYAIPSHSYLDPFFHPPDKHHYSAMKLESDCIPEDYLVYFLCHTLYFFPRIFIIVVTSWQAAFTVGPRSEFLFLQGIWCDCCLFMDSHLPWMTHIKNLRSASR